MTIAFLNRTLALTKHQAQAGLSQREHQTLLLIANGYTTKDISVVLNVAEKTVGHFMKKLKEKLPKKETTNSSTIAKWAIENGLITVDEWLTVKYIAPQNLPKDWRKDGVSK